MEDKGYLVMFVPILVLAFPLLSGEGIYSAHSSKDSALSQMGEALTKSISSSINSKYSIAKEAYLGLACLLPSLSSDECFIRGSTPCISDSSTSPRSPCLSDLVKHGRPAWMSPLSTLRPSAEDDFHVSILPSVQILSVQFSHSVVSDSLRPHGLQHARLPCPSPTLGVYSNSCPSTWWCHPTISSSVVPFSPPTFSLSQHQGIFQWVCSLHQVAKVLELHLQH